VGVAALSQRQPAPVRVDCSRWSLNAQLQLIADRRAQQQHASVRVCGYGGAVGDAAAATAGGDRDPAVLSVGVELDLGLHPTVGGDDGGNGAGTVIVVVANRNTSPSTS
jgi:hypothetical protein